MKLKEYVRGLKELMKDYPEAKEFDVVYSGDDEGNYFNYVNYAPSIGWYDEDNGEFYQDERRTLNAICIN